MKSHICKTQERSQRWLKENTKRNAFKRLEKDVIKTGACTECGACVSSCPVDALTGDRSSGKYVPELTGKCIACGICYVVCPRTLVLWREIVGDFRSAWKVRSLDDSSPRQDGGAVTAFLTHMLEEGVIEGAIVAASSPDRPWLPIAKTIEDSEEIKQYGGTIYTHTPVVAEMMESFKKGMKSVAVVGTSCNLDSIKNMKEHPAGLLTVDSSLSVFTIGLFCMESFDYEGIVDFLKRDDIDITDVKRMSISKGLFKVETSDGEKDWKVSELDSIAASSCSYCHDLTAKNADLSCGNIGSEEGWTTVLVRTVRGEHVFQEALAKGLIEAELLDAKPMRIIKRIAKSKAMRYYKLEPDH